MKKDTDSHKVKNSAAGLRLARIAVGVMALAMITAGLLFRSFADRIGIEEGQANLLSYIFLFIGVTDCLLLFFWNKLFDADKMQNK